MWYARTVLSRGMSAQVFSILAVLGLISVGNIACRTTRIGGTFIAHGTNFVDSLQLTQSEGGQLSGVLNSIKLNSEGKITSEEIPVTSGTFDGKQLTLTLNSRNVAGVVEGDTIRLQTVGSNGNVWSSELKRSSPAEFKEYVQQLKLKADGIALNTNLLKNAQESRQLVQSVESWISNAELHAQRIPGVKNYYQNIEDKMRSLVARERGTPTSVARTQLSVLVIQGNVAGIQADVQINQVWDTTIGDSGQRLMKTFSSIPSFCSNPEDIQKRGASQQAAAQWQSACQQAQTERAKFEPIYRRVMEQRADLKSFQATAQSKRQALVDEASRIQ